MFSPALVLTIVLAYIGGLFLAATLATKRSNQGRSIANHPWIYSLSLAVYCTSWTFFGSVGKAANSGLLFLAIYLGPTLGIVLWHTVLRKLVRIKSAHNITSIADFISARYDKSQGLAGLATLVALVGITPYVALQLKAIFSTFAVLTTPIGAVTGPDNTVINLVLVGALILFTIMFGVRRLAPGERHEGMVMALMVECVVKLAAFLAVGIFVTYFLYDGFGDIFTRLAASPFKGFFAMNRPGAPSLVTWTTYLLVSMSAILFLPRQFHIAVVENSDERHISTAMWMFPLYMLLINIFVVPIAAAGLLNGMPKAAADTFVLSLPMAHGKEWLGLVAFIGGFSAATGMIMVSAMTLATMITNHHILPIVEQFSGLAPLRRYILQMRWIAVVLVIVLGFIFEKTVGDSYMLVNIGMISFTAVLQFAPTIMGGLFWRYGSKGGAGLGMSAGFVVWSYTLLLPALVKSGWLPTSLMTDGLFGLDLLRPEQLLGLTGFDPISHAVFWTMAVNISGYVFGSLLFPQNQSENALANEFVDILSPLPGPARVKGDHFIPLDDKIGEVDRLLNCYLPRIAVLILFDDFRENAGIGERKVIATTELAQLHDMAEKLLAGSIGSAAAKRAMASGITYTSREAKELTDHYGSILATLHIDPHELRDRIDYYAERDKLLTSHADELQEKVSALNREIVERRRLEAQIQHTQKLESLGVLAGGIAHDFNNLLAVIMGNADIARMDVEPDSLISECLTDIEKASDRASNLCQQMLAYSGKGKFEVRILDLSEIVRDMGDILEVSLSKKASLNYVLAEDLPSTEADPTQIRQVVMNLITNASEALDGKPGTISLTTRSLFCNTRDLADLITDQALAAGNYICLTVEDDGCGMDPTTRDRVFDPFFTTKFAGRGLGMSAVSGIVRAHGGGIRIESEPDCGTSISMLLPTTDKSLSPTVADDSPFTEGEVPKFVGTILLVDDEPEVLSMGKRMLQMLGFIVFTAVDGLDALKVYQENMDIIECVVLDLTMPAMDGSETMNALRDIKPTLPVLLSSGYAEQEISRGVGQGMNGFIPKPYKIKDVEMRLAPIFKTEPR